MQKIASISIMAVSLDEKGATFLSFVSKVCFVVFPQLMRTMSELASCVVWAESGLHEFFA